MKEIQIQEISEKVKESGIVLVNGLKTRSPKLRNYNEKEINFYLSFASGFGASG